MCSYAILPTTSPRSPCESLSQINLSGVCSSLRFTSILADAEKNSLASLKCHVHKVFALFLDD